MEDVVASLVAELDASSKELESLLDGVRDLVILMDESGAIAELFVSDGCLRRETDRDADHEDALPEIANIDLVRRSVHEAISEAAESGDIVRFEIDVECGGDARPFAVQVCPRENDSGDPAGAVVVMRDTQHIEELREHLGRSRSQAEEWIRARTHFAAWASHELKTPLNGILGVARELETTALDGEQRELLELLKASSEVLADVVEDLVGHTDTSLKATKVREKPFDLSALTAALVDRISAVAGSQGIHFDCEYPNDAPRCFVGDAGRIRQVLTSLSICALESSTSANLKLVCDIDHVDDEIAELRLKFETPLRDFSPNERQEPKPLQHCELHECRRLLELLGGTFEDEQRAQNCVAQVRLPLGTLHRGSLKSRNELIDGARVLLVDPNHIRRWICEEFLRGANIEVGVADGSDDALEMALAARTSDAPIELMVVASDLRQQDGRRFGRLVKSHPDLRSTSIILVHPEGTRPDQAPGFDLGDFEAHLHRPVSMDLLLDLIAVALEPKTARSPERDVAKNSSSGVPEARDASERGNDLRILVAEDDPVSRMVTSKLLTRDGYEVVIAENGERALELFEKSPTDLALLDCQLPGISGFEVSRQLRSDNVEVPIIGMSASGVAGIEEHCQNAGMDAYLTKPLRAEKLRRLIEEWEGEVSTSKEVEIGPLPDVFAREELYERFDGDAEFIDKILQTFLDDLPTKFEKLVDALYERDSERFGRLAHALAGASAQAGARALEHLASQAERCSDLGDWKSCERLCMAIGAHRHKFESRVRSHRKDTSD